MGRMSAYALALLAMQPMIALSQSFTGYKTTTLDAVVEEWNEKTKSSGRVFPCRLRQRSNLSRR